MYERLHNNCKRGQAVPLAFYFNGVENEGREGNTEPFAHPLSGEIELTYSVAHRICVLRKLRLWW
jgi:hypothetical protein